MKRTTPPRLSCPLCLAILLISCTEQDKNSGSDSDPDNRPPSQANKNQTSSAALSHSSNIATPSPLLPPSPAVKAGPSETAPGLGQEAFIAPLRDAYDRMDPLKDGWQSEAFSAAAKKQLLKIQELLAQGEPIVASDLQDLAVRDVLSTSLRPDQLREDFAGERLRVLRASTPPPARSEGLESLSANLNQLRQQGSTVEPHLKIFRVVPESPTSAACEVLFDLASQQDSSRNQINATWTCKWELSPGDTPPMLSSIEVSKYEEIIQEGESTPLFQDVTSTLLKDDAAYQEQFLLSSDHWRARLPRELGLEPVANHGLAIGDVNGDNLDDLYICQQGGLPNRLFLQQRNGTLRDFTAESGTGWLEYCAAALLVDLDNDGDRDLIVSQDFRVLVMANDGKGAFTLAFGSSTKAQSFSLAAADYDNDGLVDFYVCGYNASHAELRGGAMGEPMPFHDANTVEQTQIVEVALLK